MPYKSVKELPEAVKGLPKHARRIWMSAFNSAHKQYGEEERAFKIAWSAVGTKYEKQGDKWVAKSQATAEEVTRHVADLRQVYRAYFAATQVEAAQQQTVWDLLGRVEANADQDWRELGLLSDVCLPRFGFEMSVEQNTDASYAPHEHDYPGSLEHRVRMVAKAAREKLSSYLNLHGGVIAVYPDFVITCYAEEADPSSVGFCYYKVSYSFDPATVEVTFGAAEEVEVLTIVVPSSRGEVEERDMEEQAKEPVGSEQEAPAVATAPIVEPEWFQQGGEPPGGAEDLTQTLEFHLEQVGEPKSGVMRIKGVATVGNVVNSKGEVYPTQVWQDNVPRLQNLLKQGKLVGESDHPADHRPSLDRTCIVYRSLWMDGDQLLFEADVLPTDPSGKNLQTLIQAGVSVDVSSRGRGNRVKGDWVHPTTGERYQAVYVVQRGFRCDAFDGVVAGASPGSTITDYAIAQQSDQGAAEEEPDMKELEALAQRIEALAAGQAQMQEIVLKLAGTGASGQPGGDAPPLEGNQQTQGALTGALIGGVDAALLARVTKTLIKDRKAELLEEASRLLPPVWLQSFRNCLDESNAASVEDLEQIAKRSLTMIAAAFEKAPKFPGGGFSVQQDAGERPGPKTPREMLDFYVRDLSDSTEDEASWIRQDTEDGAEYRAVDHIRTQRRQCRKWLQNIAELEVDGWNGPATLQAAVRLFQGHDSQQVKDAWMDQACSDCTTSVAASGAPSSAIFIFPLVRRVFPQLIAPEIASIQPMDRPDGRIFYLDTYRVSTGVNSLDEAGDTVANKMRIDRSESLSDSYADYAAECDTPNCITLRLSSKTVAAEDKALQAIWTIKELQDLRAYHNLDVGSELVAGMAREIAMEWNQTILTEMLNGATAGTRNFGTVAPSGYTQKEWDEYLVRYLDAASNDIFKKRHGDMTHVIAGPSAWLQLSASFRAGIMPASPNPQMFAGLTLTPFMAGSSVNIKTYKTSFWTGVNQNKILVIRRGSDWSDTPYVFAPYVDYISPSLMDPSNMTTRQGVMSRAAHKVVVGDALAVVNIQAGVTGSTVT